MARTREYNISALTKTLKIMDYLLEHPGASFPDICEGVDVPKSSLYQILQALVANRLVRRDADKRFHIGFRTFEYGQAAIRELDIRRAAHPILKQLAAATKLTVHLGILNEDLRGVFLDRIDGANFTFTHTRIGAEIRLETSATGRALVSWQSAAQRKALIHTLRFSGENARIRTAEEYLLECEAAVRRGYAVDAQESQPNINGVGVPIYNYAGSVCGAIAVGGLYKELDLQDCGEAVSLLQSAAESISLEMGKSPD